MKQELIAKGALAAWDLPTHVELKPSTQTPIEELWTEDQRNRFADEVLHTGGWFLECRPNFVPEEEKHLFPVPEPSAAGAAPMETDYNDDEEEEAFQLEPALKPKVQCRGQVRNRDSTVVAAPPLASTQASQPTVSTLPSPRRSNMNVDSSQTLHVKHFGCGMPPPKGLVASSSSPFKPTLPMFLEHGNFCGLLN
jgi:hypothetical protein